MQTVARTTVRLAQLEAALPAGRADAQDLRASWRRSVDLSIDLAEIATMFVGRSQVDHVVETSADRLLSESPPVGRFSVLVLDPGGVVRVRRDGDPAFAGLLDALSLSPGFDMGEDRVGTTAASLALATTGDTSLPGELHYHPQLGGLVTAAAVVPDRGSGALRALVCVVAPVGRSEDLLLAHARTIAADLGRRVAADASRLSRAVFDRFVEVSAQRSGWVVATDGAHTFLSDGTARLEPGDIRVLTDRAIGASACMTSRSRRRRSRRESSSTSRSRP